MTKRSRRNKSFKKKKRKQANDQTKMISIKKSLLKKFLKKFR